MLPVLLASSEGEVRIGAVVERLAAQLGLTPEERSELLPSGKQTVFSNRVQWAKSYLNKAGLIEITRRDFFGSLDRHKAAKGLFVTTSNFSVAAKETAELLSKRIVLIDGEKFARLMIRHNVGCRIAETLHVKRIDEDFFDL